MPEKREVRYPAAQICWQLINGRRGGGDIIAVLENFFPGPPGETAAYARKTLADLCRQGAIVPDKPGSAPPEPDTCIITFCYGDALRFPATESSPAYSYAGLFTLGTDRATAMAIPSIMGQAMGLNLDFPDAAASIIAWKLGMLDFKFDITDFFAPLPGEADG